LYAYGFRFYFTPLSGVLFAFPSRYWFTIGQLGVFSLGGWSPHLQTGFHVSRPTHRTQRTAPFQIRGYHPLWPAFPDRSPITQHDTRAGLFPVRSPLLGESRLISFPAGTEMFQFPAFASQTLWIQVRDTGQWPVGCPIRISPVHSLVAGSPKLFAGSNVLHRLQLPRHPPYALVRLTIYQNDYSPQNTARKPLHRRINA
jgi:hypothetical protein